MTHGYGFFTLAEQEDRGNEWEGVTAFDIDGCSSGELDRVSGSALSSLRTAAVT